MVCHESVEALLCARAVGAGGWPGVLRCGSSCLEVLAIPVPSRRRPGAPVRPGTAVSGPAGSDRSTPAVSRIGTPCAPRRSGTPNGDWSRLRSRRSPAGLQYAGRRQVGTDRTDKRRVAWQASTSARSMRPDPGFKTRRASVPPTSACRWEPFCWSVRAAKRLCKKEVIADKKFSADLAYKLFAASTTLLCSLITYF